MTETATLAGGCYWCLEAYYQRVRGVSRVVSGYTGGHVDSPSTERVYLGDTGHAEAIQITYDASIITYKELLEIFFVMHDPTTLNRQGYDQGEHYRSAIFYHDDAQKEIAQDMVASFAAPLYPDPIVTQLAPAGTFWKADDYMQNYYNENPSAGYCMAVIDPKIQKLRQKFAEKLV